MDRFVTRVPAASCCSAGTQCSHASSSCSSSGVRSYPRSTPPESIPAAVSTVEETPDYMIMDPPAKDTDAEDSDIGEAMGGRLLLKDGRRTISRKDLPPGYKPSFLRRRCARKSYVWAYGYPIKNRNGRDCRACERCKLSSRYRYPNTNNSIARSRPLPKSSP